MTFKKFEELLRTKYPEADITAHGKFGGTQKNGKVTIAFNPHGKTYSYYGAYEDVLCKCGIKVISRERYTERVIALEKAKEHHGKTDSFFGFVVDRSEEIKAIEAEIADYNTNYIIA